MRKVKIPTILGILILAIGVVIGVYLVQSKQIFRLRASPEITPRNIQKTNISDSSFTVTWTTDKNTEGFIKWGESTSSLDRTATTSPIQASSLHSITVYGLFPNTNYFFNINSDGASFDNENIPWEVKTGAKLITPPDSVIISGKILTQSGAPSGNTLVYASVGGGSILSTLTSDNGSWVIPASSARTQNLDSYVEINEDSTLVEISVQAANLGIASAQIYPQSAKPAPDITLGEVYDFTNLPPSVNVNIPESSIELPDTATKSSGFQISDSEIIDETVTLKGISEGGIITTNEPEFFGEGPPGTEITITIESDPQTGDVEVNQSGFWQWTPPEGLEEGLHKITLTWRDANGVLKTITRSFIVSAQEGPAFTATPSASPTPGGMTPTPTTTPSLTPTATPTLAAGVTVTITPSLSPTATPTKTPTPTKVATSSGIPGDPGFSAPTILLLILGLGLIGIGTTIFLLPKKI
jgi:hypothetical protein